MRVAPDLAHAVKRAAESKVRTIRGECVVCTEVRRFPVGLTTTYTEQDDTGAGRTATAIFQDISDQKTLDVLRLRAERLEGIAELSASLAHEIKNPLASIRSSVEQISRMPAVSDDQKTLTALVMRESDRLSRLLSEFLDFARVRVAKTEAVNLARIARDAASLAAAHPDRDSTVRVTCVIPEGDDVQIEGDEDLLHRAVFNLALNAVQASPASTEVRVEVAHGCFDPLPAGIAFEGDAVSLRVSDSGPGIPAGIRDRMFDPFFTTKANGSGLGLAVVHRAIEAHRGLVFVDNGLRGGTRFTVISADGAAAGQEYSMTGPASKPTVLVVDDESGILDSLNILLRNEGFSPHMAHGGKAGLEKIAGAESRHHPHRHSHAERQRRRDSRRGPRQRPGCSRHPHDGAGHAAIGDAGGERGRLLLHPEAVPQRRACRHPAPRRRAPQSAHREQVAEAGDSPARTSGRHATHRHEQSRGSTCCVSSRPWRRRIPRCSSKASPEPEKR